MWESGGLCIVVMALGLPDRRHRKALVEIGLLRAVEPQVDKKGLTLVGLDPVAILALRHLWAEIDIYRAVRIDGHFFVSRRPVGSLAVVADDQSVFDVVNRDGPEILRRRIGTDIEDVTLATHQRLTDRIVVGPQISRTVAECADTMPADVVVASNP